MNAIVDTRVPFEILTGLAPRPDVANDGRPVPLSFFHAGSEIYAQGEKVTSHYQIEFGAVRIYRLLADGRRQITAFHLAGEIVWL